MTKSDEQVSVSALDAAIAAHFHAGVYKWVLSVASSNEATASILEADKEHYQKVSAARQQSGDYLLEKYTKTQVFHQKLLADEVFAYLQKALQENFSQYHGWEALNEKTLQAQAVEHSIRITAKGRVLQSKHIINGNAAEQAPKKSEEHNRTKNYILPEGKPIPPLVDMGIFTPDGKVIKSMYDKYRQINRFVEMVSDEVDALPKTRPIRVVDFGCGKSYLTFVLYYYLTEIKGFAVKMVGLDLKSEVIEKCQAAAIRYGYSGLSFKKGDIGEYQAGEAEGALDLDMVITLHACDTATDYALYHAVCRNAKLIFSVPCCQHELNGQIASESFSILTRYGIVKERVSALMTDTIRANLLEYSGYHTQLLEFVDFTHTPKNILIRAVRKNGGSNKLKQKALSEVRALMSEFSLSPTLYRLIIEKSDKTE